MRQYGTLPNRAIRQAEQGFAAVAPDDPLAYFPDAVALTGLDADDRRTVIRLLHALRSGDADVRSYVLTELRLIEQALLARRQQP